MRINLKPRDKDTELLPSALDVDITATIDHIIAEYTLRYNQVDATVLAIYRRGRPLPYDKDILGLGIQDGEELEIGRKPSHCCMVL